VQDGHMMVMLAKPIRGSCANLPSPFFGCRKSRVIFQARSRFCSQPLPLNGYNGEHTDPGDWSPAMHTKAESEALCDDLCCKARPDKQLTELRKRFDLADKDG
jgi:hypothetical protein